MARSLVDANYFLSIQTVALTDFAIFAGVLRIFHRYKAILTTGLLIRSLGVRNMIHSRGAHASTVQLVWTQIIQALGGGFASVPHADVALVTALVLLVTEVAGGAIGNAMTGAIWANTMPGNLARFLSNTPKDVRDALYTSTITVRSIPKGDAVREGVILAYGETMKVMLIAATAVSIVPIALSLIMPNWVLGDEKNAVTGTDLKGERTDPVGEAVTVHDENGRRRRS